MKKRLRGMALMSVLLAAVVLAMLSTALVALNRSGFLSLHQYEERSMAMQACYAGLDYARARLTQMPFTWSTLPYGPLTSILNEPTIQVDESGQTLETNLISGRLHQSGSTFQVQVESNLSSSFRLPAPTWSRSGMTIAPRCAFVAVEGQKGSVRRRIEVLLMRKTGVGGAIYAGRDLAISLNLAGPGKVLKFSSTVPKSNLVKVNGTVRLPDPEQVDFGSGGHGRLQSGADTIVNSTYQFNQGDVINPQNGQGLSGNGSLTAAVSREVKATITTSSPPTPPKFTPDQLKQPAGASPGLPAGYYHFITDETVSYRPTPTGPQTIYNKTIRTGSTVVELSEYRFMPQGNVEILGDLHLSGEQTEAIFDPQGRTVSQKVTQMPVTLAVGYDKGGLPLSYSALGTGTTTKSRLTVTGAVEVQGDLIGSGQIFVKKDSQGQGGTMHVNGNSFLSATRTDGMALVTEGSVSFGEVDPNTSTQLFAMLPDDFDLYAEALQGNFSQSVRDTFPNWQGSGAGDRRAAVGSSDMPGSGTLRNTPLTANYDNILARMLPSGMTPNGKNLATLMVPIEMPDLANGGYALTGMTADVLIADYVRQSKQLGMTLGLHTRLREFIKSLDRGNPNSAMINLWNPDAFASQDETMLTLVANQMSAYNQDARSNGMRLLDYMRTSNPYSLSQRRDFIFGGILYAKGNVFTKLASSFTLLGAMLSENGTLGFDHLTTGKIVYDPNSFEDQFDITKLGLGPAFFWVGP